PQAVGGERAGGPGEAARAGRAAPGAGLPHGHAQRLRRRPARPAGPPAEGRGA
ncbi:unnamed protein product, partial [Heterosigma akashiwo]